MVYGPRSGGRPLLILRFPCLWPFSLLLCSARLCTHCIQLHPSLLFSGRSIRVDFLGFLRLVRPNRSPCLHFFCLPYGPSTMVPRLQSPTSTALASTSTLTGRRRVGLKGRAPFSAASGGFGRSGGFHQGTGLKSSD